MKNTILPNHCGLLRLSGYRVYDLFFEHRKMLLNKLRKAGLPLPEHAVFDEFPLQEPKEHWQGRLKLALAAVDCNTLEAYQIPGDGRGPIVELRWFHDRSKTEREITLDACLRFANVSG